MNATRTLLMSAIATSVLATGIVAQERTASAKSDPDSSRRIARGEYLVKIGGCNDCHTPHRLGPRGPEPDMTRALTGHPADLAVAAAPALGGSWMWAGTGEMTAFSGPWGISFTANLTPDEETGLGKWTEQMFIDTMRTGRHQGKGRPVLPPMPYQAVGAMTDEDLRSLFAYLRSLRPVRNRVPAPIDPPDAAGQ